MKRGKTDTLIFDLGGVILDLDLDGAFRRFSELMDGETMDLHQAYLSMPFIRQYEIGAIDTPAFIRQFQGVFNREVSAQEFRDLWYSMLVGIPSERIEWLGDLRKRFRLVLLSNTNALHIEHVERILQRDTGTRSLDDIFHKTYYSHVINRRKPDENCYRFVLEDLKSDPARCLFYDDNRDNITAAEGLGMPGVLVPYNQLSRQLLFDVE